MNVRGLPIPKALLVLLANGIWPSTREAQQAQERNPILGKDAAQKLSPEDDRICLSAPPFSTIAMYADSHPKFWLKFLTNVGEVDYEKSVIIGDFGIGSDSPIILNYELSNEPRVMYLKWSGNGKDIKHSWVCTHESFDLFLAAVNLTRHWS